ncbi:ornithine decarboxylase antizyme-domain-containing protein [Geopyxis carbonaria]|nr:ornithine decarboxylase antizyme-domain-containing protein [Geopyxis carbonaria]
MRLLFARRWFRGFITLLPAPMGYSGVPEALSGYPQSPPSNNGFAGSKRHHSNSPVEATSSQISKGALSNIAKECERLLCGDMTRIFLGGRNDSKSDHRSMNLICSASNDGRNERSSEIAHYTEDYGHDEDMRFIEVWDYVGGTSFRGFIADKELPRGRVEKTLFLFFECVMGTQLKHGLMALIELASECFSCDRLVICLERNAEGLQGLVRDLGWVGFELITLSHWVQSEHQNPEASVRSASFSSTSTMSSVFSDDDITSEKWLYMGMEV